VGSNPTTGVDNCVPSVFVWSCVGSGLVSADPLSKESYPLFTRFTISELILNGTDQKA
jgi:hypothetical protein